MVYAMDTLGYAKRLRDAGIPEQQAEAHAEAARDFVMAELVTKTDLQSAMQAAKSDLQATRNDLQATIQISMSELQNALNRLESKIEAQGVQIDTQALRLMVRLGGLLGAGIAILTAILKLT